MPEHIKVPKHRPYRIYGISGTHGVRRVPHMNFSTRQAAEEACEGLGYFPIDHDDWETFMVVDAREQVRRS